MRHFFSALFLCGLLGLTGPGTAVKAQVVYRPEADSLRRVLGRTKADTNRVNVLLRLGEYQVYKPGEFKADMDSARMYAGQARALSRKLGLYRGEIKSLNLLGTVSRESRDFPQAIAFQQAAIRLSKAHKAVQAEAESYLMLAHALRNKGDAEEARRQVQKAIDLSTHHGYLEQAAEAYLELGNSYANQGEELKKKISYYHKARQLFARASNKRRQADVLKDLGDLYGLQENNAQALIELRKALDLYRSINYPHLQGVYDLLGDISSSLGDYQQGVKYGLLAVETAESLGDSSLQLCTIYNRVGMTYYYFGQYQKAYEYYKKSLLVAQKYNDLTSIFIVTGNIAFILAQLHQPREGLALLLKTTRQYPPQTIFDSIRIFTNVLRSYTDLKQYKLAQRYCDQLLFISGKLEKDNAEQPVIYAHIIPFFLASKQHEQTRRYLAEYERVCKKARLVRGVAKAQLWRFKLDSMQANYPSAIRHYQHYKQVEDSLLNETKSRQIASLEVLHETERKEKEIQLKAQSIKALTKERQLQAEQIKRDELIRNVIIGGAALLLLLLGVIYNRYRLKKRSNLLLRAQQRQLQAQQQALQAQQQELQAQHQELLAQKDVLLAQQGEINRKNEHLSQLLGEKDSLLGQKDTLIGEKEGLLSEKDTLLSQQERLLAEKERLLKEIHHRVKNNLQVVMSLLNSQADSLQDKAALSAIQESQHRVQAMAFIHQKLYQSEGIARIPMQDYIEEVVAYLHESYCLDQLVRFCVEVEPIELDVTQAVPLGLIINEVITNAFKYAFPDGRPGTVRLSLHRQGEAAYQLTIADDGVGLPPHYDPSQSRSLGMTLLHGFSGQLGGQLSITSQAGLTINLTFEEEQLSPGYAPVAYARQ